MKILDIALKDLVRSTRSIFAVGMMFLAPLLIAGMIYLAFGSLRGAEGGISLPVTRVVVVDQDAPTPELDAGSLIVQALSDPDLAGLLETRSLSDESEARRALEQREADVAVLIPVGLSRAVSGSGEPATIVVLHDPVLTVGPGIVEELIRQYADAFSGATLVVEAVTRAFDSQGLAPDPAVLLQSVTDYAAWAQQTAARWEDGSLLSLQPPSGGEVAPESDWLSEMISKTCAGMLVFFNIFTGSGAAQSILREEEEGTLARLFTTPVSRTSVLAGKFVAVVALIVGQALVLMAASSLAFGIRWGDPPAVALVLVGMVVLAAGLSILVISFVKNLRQAGPILGGVLTTSGMLGGLFTTAIAMPEAFSTINLLMPQGWAMRGWSLALQGADAAGVLPTVLVMLAMGILSFAAGAWRFRRRFG